MASFLLTLAVLLFAGGALVAGIKKEWAIMLVALGLVAGYGEALYLLHHH